MRKIHLRCIIDLNMKAKPIKLLEASRDYFMTLR